MTNLQSIVLGLVQGLSEFLPISSSGHLILVPLVTGWADQGLTFDVAVHLGSLGAVLLYFRRDLFDMLKGVGDWSEPGLLNHSGRHLIALIAVGTIPIIFGGIAIKLLVGTENLRNAYVVGCTSIFFGSALYIADKVGARERGVSEMGFSHALIIGCAQVLALIPGTSRSGVTMTAARLLGLHRAEAARFSFLLSIPAILAAGLLVTLEVMTGEGEPLDSTAILGLIAAFISAWAAIAFLMQWLRQKSFTEVERRIAQHASYAIQGQAKTPMQEDLLESQPFRFAVQSVPFRRPRRGFKQADRVVVVERHHRQACNLGHFFHLLDAIGVRSPRLMIFIVGPPPAGASSGLPDGNLAACVQRPNLRSTASIASAAKLGFRHRIPLTQIAIWIVSRSPTIFRNSSVGRAVDC